MPRDYTSRPSINRRTNQTHEYSSRRCREQSKQEATYHVLHNDDEVTAVDLYNLGINAFSAAKINNIQINEITNVLLDLVHEQHRMNVKLNTLVGVMIALTFWVIVIAWFVW